ncbi:hypothetical protein [Rhizobium halophilum]|uniref:hypothetical protein n=1 Tax=Rhizobium halophilum TaxID=2846852 RepID=UPI001EFC5221|nr:hypothetical protein [Rhizobium halophilum]MCF6369688.1 hypothetical protein [Rhizobium halophilum]
MLQEVLQIAKVLADGPGRQADLCLDSGGFSRFAQFFAPCAELWGRHDPHPAASAPVRRNVVGVLPQLTDVKLRDLSGMLDPMFLEHCVEHPDQGYRVAPGVASARLRGTKER